jgi:hypothetical protein
MKQRIAMKDEYGIADNYAYNGDLYFAMKISDGKLYILKNL